MSNVMLYKSLDAGGELKPHRIVKPGDSDREVAQATGDTGPLVGVNGRLGADKAGERVEVARVGIADVEYGGAVTRGDKLTSDADGKAVKAEGAGIHQAVVNGAAANTDIAVEGILTTDELVGVVNLDDHDTPAGVTIHADGKIRSTDATNGDQLAVTWRRPVSIIGSAEISGVDGDIGEVLIAPAVL